MANTNSQLISYIAPAAPATRRPVTGREPALRPEIGFTPRWYHESVAVDFDCRWHTDPVYREETVIEMRQELARRFAGTGISGIDQPDKPLDLLTGTFGACSIAAIYGVPIRYSRNGWPVTERLFLPTEDIDKLEPPDLDVNPFFLNLLSQVDRISERQRPVEGYMNWQGVLNNAWRLRGEALFTDLYDVPQRCHRLFDCVCTTMIEAAGRLAERQQKNDVEIRFITISNCLVNMVSPEQYREFLLPLDKRMAEAFDCIGIHNCAWNADPYLEDYAKITNIGYIDMGIESNLADAKRLFPNARRALMYKPTEFANKPWKDIQADIETIARDYAPCDIVVADIEAGMSDQRVLDFVKICDDISHTM